MTQTERVSLTFPRSGQQLSVNVPSQLAAKLRESYQDGTIYNLPATLQQFFPTSGLTPSCAQ